MGYEHKIPNISSLRAACIQRSSNSSSTKRFISSLCWLISVESTMKIAVLYSFTIRVLLRKRVEIKIMENLMGAPIDKGK